MRIIKPEAQAKSQLLQYSALALALACAGLPVYVHAPEFYASELGLPLAAIGFVLLALRAFDAVQDPLIGSYSDRWHQHRKAIMVGGIVLLALGFWLLFHPASSYPLAWLALSVALCTTGFSVVSINFQAIGGLWQAEADERTRITTWREAVGLLGLLLASIAPTLLGSDARAFHWLALLYLPLLAFCSWIFFRWLRRARLQSPSSAPTYGSLRHMLRGWNAAFFSIYLSNAVASSIPAVLVLFFINDRIVASELTGLFLLLYFLSGACTMPIWQRLAARLGKARAWLWSMVLAALTFSWAFSLGAGEALAYALVCVLSGLALGADLALPPAIIADRIAQQQEQHLASRYFAVLTFLSKAALALATGLALPALGYLGYQPSAVSDYAITDYLAYAYALVPSILKAGVAGALWWLLSRAAGNGKFDKSEQL